MKKFKFNIRGNEYNVEILNLEDNIAEVEVNGSVYQVEIERHIKQTKTPKLLRPQIIHSEKMPGEGEIKKKEATERHKVTAPLPGTILKINVAIGDTVTENQNIMVMEAMKMENSLRAINNAKIKSILVEEGDNLTVDQAILEFED